MTTFEELVGSRRDWIESVLKPWCRAASRKELLKAEEEWHNLAGRVDPERTLWLWAWSRFPALVTDGLHGINETYEVIVTRTGEVTAVRGYPDARESRQGRLVLDASGDAIDIDDIAAVGTIYGVAMEPTDFNPWASCGDTDNSSRVVF